MTDLISPPAFAAYAKATVKPRLTDDATHLLIDKYMFMRKVR